MFSQDSQGIRKPGVAAQVGLCAVLALFFALGGDRFVGIERGFYDLCQRLSAAASLAPVIIISPDNATPDLWTMPRLDELISKISAAGAKVIIPAAPAPPPVTAVDVTRLQSLIRVEQHGGSLQNQAEPGLLQRQLAETEQRISQQQRLSAAVLAAGNVVLGLATTERRPGSDTGGSVCAERISRVSERFANQDAGQTATAALVPASATLCEAAAAVGHMAHLTDRDGVVRRTAP
ncbi:MAG: CHASE2 domain-containing protein, partial [Gammaproteobacteria bacterium]|nr:CHASE2 domain-containing protein [Gammaproteobacteria bacterium]